MAVCQFFLRGQCKFGNSCRNQHPSDSQRQSGFGNQSWISSNSKVPIFSAESMTKDFTANVDKPIWPLSSYGPAKYEPTLMPNLDESPEELRVKAVMALQTGAINDYLQYESDKISVAEQVFMNARNNITQAYQQAVKQSAPTALESIRPSSVFGENTTGPTAGAAFGGGSSTAFGQPSAFGAIGGPASAFQPSTSTTSVFGSSTTPISTFGKSAFGQPTFGQSANPTVASPFGQSSSVFGQPQQSSSFGQVAQSQSSFIKPATGAFSSAAGGVAFGVSSQPPFGAAASNQHPLNNPGPTSGTGTGTAGGFSAFAGQPATFGLNATTNAPAGGSVFGQPSFGNTSTPASAFGAPASAQGSTPSAFGALTQQQAGPISAFGNSSFTLNQKPAGSVFDPSGTTSTGSFSSTDQTISSFPSQPQKQSLSAFTPPQQTSVFGVPSQQPTSVFSSQLTAPSLPSKPQANPPDFSVATSMYQPGLDKYDSLLPDNYLEMMPKSAREAFESKKFVWGNVPEWIPPKELR